MLFDATHTDTGNEASITEFIKNTGIMLEIAPQFKAMVVFVEHRYYGDSWTNGSWPFGTAAFEPQNLRYLTVEQALADFVEVRCRARLVDVGRQRWTLACCVET